MAKLDYEQVVWTYSETKKNFSQSELAEALEQVVVSGNLDFIYPLTALALHPAKDIREKAWAIVDFLLADAKGEDLIKIDQGTREHRIFLEHIKMLDELTLPTNILGLLSFNASGYIRERALKKLVTRFDGIELPFLLLRLNDWIEIIHHQALAALKERLVRDYGKHFAASLFLIKHLSTLGRYNHNGTQELIASVLCTPHYIPELLNSMQSKVASQRLFALNLLLKIDSSIAAKAAINAALSSADASLRLRALEFACKNNKVNLVELPITALLQDKAAPVRLEALRWLAEKQDCREILLAAFFDSSSAVRLFARYKLKDVDAKAVYLQNLKSKEKSLLFTLRGLFEIEAIFDVEAIKALTREANGKVRALAFKLLLVQNSSEDKSDLLFQALVDKSNHCSRAAHEYLSANPDAVQLESLFALANQNLYIKAQCSLIAAIADAPPWINLPYLLALKKTRSNTESSLDAALDRALEHWLDRTASTYTTPNSAVLARLSTALGEAKAVLTHEQFQSIKAVLNRH